MSAADHVGAYGFRIVPAQAGVVLPGLVPVPPTAETVPVAWEVGPVEHDLIDVGEDRARLSVTGMVAIEVTRAPASLTVRVPEEPAPEAIVHPILTTPLAILARWRGVAGLHAGAVLHDGRAVAVCGRQNAGKSTALALLAARGMTIVTDDLLAVEHGEVLAGPSCVDLRSDTAQRFPDATFLGVVGARERHRLITPPAPPRVPLAGIFLLEWGDAPDPETVPLGLHERMELIHAFDYAALVGLPRPETLMDLLELPMWRLVRPREWEAGERALDLMLTTAAATPATRTA